MVARKRNTSNGGVPDGQTTSKRVRRTPAIATTESTPEPSTPEPSSSANLATCLAKLKAPLVNGEKPAVKKGVYDELPLLSDIEQIFEDMVDKAWKLGFDQVVIGLGRRPLRIATLCSGTESPILAMKEIQSAVRALFGEKLNIEHQYSVEIEPFKQAYIEKNFAPEFLFRDVTELADGDKAHTAYAGRHEVPGDGDIWIAGASCVDFSRLNTKRNQSINSRGESADTFRGVLMAVARWRPGIVILENVLHAPWNVLKAVMENNRKVEDARPLCEEAWAIDDPAYATFAVMVDTKNFYLPHTRQRGYMICFNRASYPCASRIVAKCQTLMEGLQRYPSASVEDFILPDNDPRVRLEKLKYDGKGKTQAQNGWDKCRATHENFRIDKKLGNARPVTFWQQNGGAQPLDFMWTAWVSKSSERVRDFLDIAQLQSVNRGFDAFFKSAIWDLSQGVNRRPEPPYFGVSPCLTPNGIPFLTSRGGPVTGLESLALQGLPIENLILKDESDRDLQNLAGNAMSSTVVGAAMIAAMIAGLPILQDRMTGREPVLDQDNSHEPSKDMECLRRIASHEISDSKKMTSKDLISLAKRTVLFCYCETPSSRASAPLQKCQDCAHTSCEKCGKNPKHRYQQISPIRNPSLEFDKAVRAALPLGLQFSANLQLSLTHLSLQSLDPDEADRRQKYYRGTDRAFADRFHFAGTTCTRQRAVNYEGSHSRLVLDISEDQALWKLYAKADVNQSKDTEIRKLFEHPVARMKVSGDKPLHGQWVFRKPTTQHGEIQIKGRGHPIKSWPASLGLQTSHTIYSTVWESLDVSSAQDTKSQLGLDICGRYSALQECGMAMGSLYKKHKTSADEPNIFFFLDQNPVGLQKDDSFVFSTTKDRLDPKVKRETIARLHCKYRLSMKRKEVVSYSSFGQWQECSVSLKALEDADSIQYSVLEPHRLGDLTIKASVAPGLSGPVPKDLDCKMPIALLDCKLPASAFGLVRSAKIFSQAASVKSLSKQLEILHGLSFLIEPLRGLCTPSFSWQRLSVEQGYVNCTLCAPHHPILKWTWRDKKSTKEGVVHSVCVPFEDGIDAGRYERALKARPPPLVVEAEEDESGEHHLKFRLNIAAMAHRLLQRTLRWPSVVLEYQLDATVMGQAEGNEQATAFTLLNNNEDPEYAIQLPGKKQLRPEQCRSLGWMIQQEQEEGVAFTNQEVEECVIPRLGWRADVRASATMKVRGGILADAVGFGKTALCLAIHHAQFSKAEEHANTISEGLIHVKATLIIVPGHLTGQWTEQVKMFLGKKRIVLINTASDLKKASIEKIQEAEFVIASSSIFSHRFYEESIALFAALPRSPNSGSRAFNRWFERALSQIEKHAYKLQEVGPRELASHLQEEMKNYNAALGTEPEKPTRRLRGAAYKKKNADSPIACEEQVESPSMEVTSRDDATRTTVEGPQFVEGQSCDFLNYESMGEVKSINLHLFDFHRIIEDEISYTNDHQATLISSLKANCRWLLSGTLCLESFLEVLRLSSLLGLPLGAKREKVGVLKHGYITRVRGEKTDLESFEDRIAELHTANWHARQHDLAQTFLHTYARRNELDNSSIKLQTHLCIITLSPLENLDYQELHMRIMSQEFTNLKAGVKRAHNDRSQRVSKRVATSNSCTDALLTSCSFPLEQADHQEKQVNEDGSETTVDCFFAEIITSRKKDVDSSLTNLDELISCAVLLHLKDQQSSEKPFAGFETWKTGIVENNCGDGTLSHLILKKITSTEEEYRTLDEDQVDQRVSTIVSDLDKVKEKEDEEKKAGQNAAAPKGAEVVKLSEPGAKSGGMEVVVSLLKAILKELSRTTLELVDRVQVHRYACNVEALQTAMAHENATLTCSHCEEIREANGLMLLGSCGHLLCNACLSKFAHLEGCCLVAQCSASIEPHWLSKASTYQSQNTSVVPRFGAKLDDVVDLIQNRIERDDQVILFVQLTHHIELVSSVLSRAGIKHTALSSSYASKQVITLKDFQNSDAEKYKTLILSCADISIAGSNLTNANHVVFLSPVPATSQYKWESQYTQAIGRSRRYGQTKLVHVYHYLALHTIDVDLFEKWSHKKLHKSSKTQEWMTSPVDDMNDEEKKQKWQSGFFESDRPMFQGSEMDDDTEEWLER